MRYDSTGRSQLFKAAPSRIGGSAAVHSSLHGYRIYYGLFKKTITALA
jgi:hypothetical protein